MFGKHKKRPTSADGDRPTSSKIVRPCSVESSRPASADESGSARSSRRSTPRKRPRKPRAFSTNSSPKGVSRDGSPKSSSRPHSPAGSSKSRSSSSSTFRRWGSPYPPNSKNSTRPCSPDYTVVSLEDKEGGFPEQKRPRGQPSPELALKFGGGTNPASRRLMQVMMCAATARAPFPEAKVRKLVLCKNTDKENLVDELQSLKVAVADQAYHFQLHKTHLHGLQIEQNELEKKIAALESVDGSNAPRTGGKGRLESKISGLRVMVGNLTDDITKHHETIQNLKYRYQVCQTREVTIQRDLAAGDVWRLQKQIRNTRDVLMALTKHNKKFLYLRDKTLPELREKLKRNQEKIKGLKLSIKAVEKVSKQFTADSHSHSRAAEKAESRARGLVDEGKRMRAKLKQERETKRKNQQDVWIFGYETRTFVKDNRHRERQKQMKEAALAAKTATAGEKDKEKEKEKPHKKFW